MVGLGSSPSLRVTVVINRTLSTGTLVAKPIAGTPIIPVIPWVLRTGMWDDLAPWADTELWKDAA